MNKALVGVVLIALLLPVAAFANGDDESEAFRVPRGGVYMVQSAPVPGDEEGILITGVIEDSPAEKAGLMRGDILLAVDGNEVNTLADLQNLLADYEAGQTVDALVSRGGEEITVEVVLETRLYRPAFGIAGGRFGNARGPGFEMPFGGQFDMPHGRGNTMPHRDFRGPAPYSDGEMPFGYRMDPDGEWFPGSMMFGDVVRTVEAGSPADEAGIVAGDIIVRIDDTELDDMTIGDAVREYSPGDTVEIEIGRHTARGELESVVVTVTLGANDDGGAFLGIGYAPMRFGYMGGMMNGFGFDDSESYPRGFRGLRGYQDTDDEPAQDMSL